MKKNKQYKKIIAVVEEKWTVKKVFFLVLIFISLFFISKYSYQCLFEKVCDNESLNRFVRHDVTITTPKGAITAEVADTKSSRELGLSNRKSMQENEAMLFVFDSPGRYGFWMKDMAFPLDIVWINQNGVVVEIQRNVLPESYPKTFMNASPANYVLELPAGISLKQSLYIGSKVKIIE